MLLLACIDESSPDNKSRAFFMPYLMENPTNIDIQTVIANIRKELESPEFKQRVEETNRAIDSMYSHAKIDRSKLFTPVDF